MAKRRSLFRSGYGFMSFILDELREQIALQEDDPHEDPVHRP